jgi:D-alanine-D-alanine ligase
MQTVVGILRGGPSREHEVSLKTGASMLAALPEDRFIARDIYIDKQGVWHDRGRPSSPERVLRQLDLVLLGLHGEYGEDGEVQKLLERFGVRYAGADSWGSSLAMHKVMSKAKALEAGLRTAAFQHIERDADLEAAAHRVVRELRQPVVVKPVGWGSSVGVSVVGGYAPILSALRTLSDEGAPSILVEEFIRGREATVGIVEGLRGEALYALPAVEIIPPEGDFFSYGAKYSGTSREIVPGNFSRADAEELAHAAKVMHRALGLRHYSRSDFIVTPQGIYYLETNSLPALNDEGTFSRALASVGVTLPAFCVHVTDLVLT